MRTLEAHALHSVEFGSKGRVEIFDFGTRKAVADFDAEFELVEDLGEGVDRVMNFRDIDLATGNGGQDVIVREGGTEV